MSGSWWKAFAWASCVYIIEHNLIQTPGYATAKCSYSQLTNYNNIWEKHTVHCWKVTNIDVDFINQITHFRQQLHGWWSYSLTNSNFTVLLLFNWTNWFLLLYILIEMVNQCVQSNFSIYIHWLILCYIISMAAFDCLKCGLAWSYKHHLSTPDPYTVSYTIYTVLKPIHQLRMN